MALHNDVFFFVIHSTDTKDKNAIENDAKPAARIKLLAVQPVGIQVQSRARKPAPWAKPLDKWKGSRDQWLF